MMRMPRYDVRNDGVGPYATFYCDVCRREFRSTPSIGDTIAKDVGRSALGGLLRNIPVVGWDIADNMQDSRYSAHMSGQQLDGAWQQIQQNFHECPTCGKVVCAGDWDALGNSCIEDSPRRAEIARAQAEQAAGLVQGFASAFGLGGALQDAGQAARAAAAAMPRCGQCGTVVGQGVKFCPQCGGAVIQPGGASASTSSPQPTSCPNCGSPVAGKFCGACGSKVT